MEKRIMDENVVTLQLSMDVTYNLNGTSIDELKGLLDYAVKHLSGNGMLSGETPATVEGWDHEITDVTAAYFGKRTEV
jgi:hypothetical protein